MNVFNSTILPSYDTHAAQIVIHNIHRYTCFKWYCSIYICICGVLVITIIKYYVQYPMLSLFKTSVLLVLLSVYTITKPMMSKNNLPTSSCIQDEVREHRSLGSDQFRTLQFVRLHLIVRLLVV